MSLPTTPPLSPVPDQLPHHTAYGVDGQGHRHTDGCWWDVLECGWRCVPSVATTPPVPREGLGAECPDVA